MIRMTATMHRPGFVMPLVLIVLAVLTLAVSIFAENMLVEYRATRSMAGQLQAACAAQSGVEFVRVRSLRARNMAQPEIDNEGIQFLDATHESGFWIAPERISRAAEPKYGLTNESSKLNLNGLALDLGNADTSRQRLMQLPKMTPQIADAILDWIDADDSPRAAGAERNWYVEAGASRLPVQRPLKELAELLNVRGVTSQLLFGEDTNQNGWLDDCEDDGDITSPSDNADGQLQRGWSEFLTVVGAESNFQTDGRPKIYLNDSNLVTLYDRLLPELGQTATVFIVAMRLEGPHQQGDVLRDSEQTERDERLRSAPQRIKDQLDRVSASGPARKAQTRGGMDLSAQPMFVVRSMADLVGQEVLTIINGQQELVRSPWDLSQIEPAMARLERICTTKAGTQRTERINIQTASARTLQTIPGLDSNLARSIVARRGAVGRRESPGWLVRDGLLKLDQLRELAPYMTCGGDVWSGNSIGTAATSNSLVAVHFVIDATLPESRLLAAEQSVPFTLPLQERPRP